MTKMTKVAVVQKQQSSKKIISYENDQSGRRAKTAVLKKYILLTK